MAPRDGRPVDTAIHQIRVVLLTRTRVIWRRRAQHTALIRFLLGLSLAPGLTVVVVARILLVLFVYHLHLFISFLGNCRQSSASAFSAHAR